MQPIAIFMGSQSIVAMSTLIIFLFLLIVSRFHINIYVYLTFIFTTLIFLINYFLFNSREIILFIYAEFVVKSFSLFLIGSFAFSVIYLKKYFYIFSIINLFSLLSIVVLGYIGNFSYMRFGYALLPTLLLSIYALRVESNKILWSIITISSFILILIFGSRGPLLGLIIFLLIIIIADSKMQFTKKLLITFGVLISYIYFVPFNGFAMILDYIYFDLNFQTYSIRKLKLMLEEGLAESSSGRDQLYVNFIDQILIHPVWGSGIGITQEIWGYTPHNLFLQILIEFGIIGMLFLLVISLVLGYFLIKIRSKDNDLFLLLSIIFSVSISRLLVSSDLWLRPELWLFISLVINGFLIIKFKDHTSKKSNRTY